MEAMRALVIFFFYLKCDAGSCVGAFIGVSGSLRSLNRHHRVESTKVTNQVPSVVVLPLRRVIWDNKDCTDNMRNVGGYVATDLDLFNTGVTKCFVLDTGCSISIILGDQEVTSDSVNQQQTIYGLGGLPIPAIRSESPLQTQLAITLQPYIIHGKNAAATAKQSSLPTGVSGILGLDFLAQFSAVAFDLAQGLLELHHQQSLAPNNITNNEETLALRDDFRSLLTLDASLTTTSTEETEPIVALLDLGSSFSCVNWKAANAVGVHQDTSHVERDVLKANTLTDDDGGVSVDRATFKRLSLRGMQGDFRRICTSPTLHVADLPYFDTESLRGKPAMILGLDLLLEGTSRIILDMDKRSLRIVKNRKSTESDATATSNDVESEMKKLTLQLSNREVKFAALQEELDKENVSHIHCRSTDDFIRRVAQLRVLGSTYLRSKLDSASQQDGPAASIVEKLRGELGKLDQEAKQMRLLEIAKAVSDSGVYSKFEKASDLVDAYATLQVQGRLPSLYEQQKRRSQNSGCVTVDAYTNESAQLTNIFKSLSPSSRDEFMQQVTVELDKLQIDYHDCETEQHLVNRLAYARVFPRRMRSTRSRQAPSRRITTPSGIHVLFGGADPQSSPSSGLQNFFESPFDQILEELFGGGSGDGWSFGGSDEEGGSKGARRKHNQRDELAFSTEQKKHDQREPSEEEQLKKEKEPLLQRIVARIAGDHVAQKFLLKFLKDPEMRVLLREAESIGYEKAVERYENNPKKLYIVEKLRELRIIIG